jgi:DNA primase
VNGTSRTNRFSTIAYQNLNVVGESGDEICSECPFCNGASTLYFNDVKGLWVCFKCGAKGTAKTLVKELNGTYTEPELELEHISDQLRSLDPRIDSAIGNTRTISDSQLLRFRRPGEVHELWGRRGFDAATCERWELGYDFLSNTLTLPYRDPFTGHVAGIIRRSTSSGDGPRYQFPSGFARRSSLHGSWLIHGDTIAGSRSPTDPVIVTEGPTDSAKTNQALRDEPLLPVSKYGSSINAGQIRLLHRLGVQNLILFYDYDRAGLAAMYKDEDLANEFMVEKVRWNRNKFCWHRRVCGCPGTTKDQWKEHTWALPQCPSKRDCQCGRIHEPDPGSLDEKEIVRMIERRVGI